VGPKEAQVLLQFALNFLTSTGLAANFMVQGPEPEDDAVDMEEEFEAYEQEELDD
jgi:hypothetical protein